MKTKRLFTAAIAAALATGVAFARPADPRVQTVTAADGSVMEVIHHGDEFFDYYTTADLSQVVERGADGKWRQTMLDGRMLVPSQSDLMMLRNATGDRMNEKLAMTRSGMHKMAARDPEGRSVFPTIGTDIHGLVVLFEFADCSFSVPDIRNQIDKMVNQQGYSDFGAVGSARDYYIASSAGKFAPTFDISPVVKLPKTVEYYVQKGADPNLVPNPGRTGFIGEAIAYALNWLNDNTDIDFSKYDYDNDGIIDSVFFYYAGYGQADSSTKNVFWPHQQDYNNYIMAYPNLGYEEVILDGKKFGPYACSNELKGNVPENKQPYLDGIGAFCHEFGHVLGIPDLYDPSGSEATFTPGYMSVMCSGSYNRQSTQPPLFSAYEKWALRWLEYTDAERGHGYDIPSLAKENKAIRIRLPKNKDFTSYYPNEYYILETRTPDGWDESLPDHGIVVWHIRYNEKNWEYNQVNYRGDSRVAIVTHNDFDALAKNYCWGFDTNTYIVPGMDSALVCADFRNPFFSAYLTDMEYDEQTGSGYVNYDVYTETPTDVTVLAEPLRPEGNVREITFNWEPVDGATNYYLSVYRKDNKGNNVYLTGYKDKPVGLTTTHAVKDLSAAVWNSTVYAHVRVVKGFPSTKTSNVVEFTPRLLETSGIEDIVAAPQTPVYGLHGSIVAPEGSEVYNMSGLRVGTENLPAGIYIVRHTTGTTKVMVK